MDPSYIFREGERLTIRIGGKDVPGLCIMAATNGRSLMLVADDGGLPLPWALLGERQSLCPMFQEDGTWRCIATGHTFELIAHESESGLGTLAAPHRRHKDHPL